MTDHVHEALRRYEAADYARQMTDTDPDLLVTVALHESAQAQVHATLEVAEHVEYAGEQLRRLADSVQALVDVVREHLAGDVDEHDDDAACATCTVPRGAHALSVRDHEWIRA